MDHECNKEDVIDRNKEDIGTLFELVEKIRSRLPNVATLIISLLSLAIGSLATLCVGMLMKLKGS